MERQAKEFTRKITECEGYIDELEDKLKCRGENVLREVGSMLVCWCASVLVC